MAGYSTLVCLLVGCLLASSVEGGPFKCNKQGRFPDPGDCGSFVDCFLDSNGEMVRREGQCWGFPYSPNKKRCVSHDERPDCKLDTPTNRKPLGSLSSLSYHCTEKNSVGCHHCYVGYNCINGEAYVNVCDPGNSCTEHETFPGSCLPQDNLEFAKDECLCDEFGLFGDFYNLTYFHHCDTIQKKVTTYQCPDEHQYNDVSKACETTTTQPPPAVPNCTGTGTRVNPNNCQYYYTCLPNGAIQMGNCKPEEYFNEDIYDCVKSCDLVVITPSPEDKCPGAGKFVDAQNCTTYHTCLGVGNLFSTTTCPSSTYFDSSTNLCVSGPLPDDCFQFNYSDCPGYDSLDC